MFLGLRFLRRFGVSSECALRRSLYLLALERLWAAMRDAWPRGRRRVMSAVEKMSTLYVAVEHKKRQISQLIRLRFWKIRTEIRVLSKRADANEVGPVFLLARRAAPTRGTMTPLPLLTGFFSLLLGGPGATPAAFMAVSARRHPVPVLAGAAREEVPPLDQHPRRRVALLVEPTPFTHVSGYSNRFKEMLRFLVAGGDEAAVITPDDTPERPHEFLGVPITYVPGFRLIVYQSVQLTLDIGFKALNRLKEFKPDLIHVATPGVFVLPTILYARMLQVPLVISYHTHLSVRARRGADCLRGSRDTPTLGPSKARPAARH